jgi:drug/metabolite transporter (DMT)-like permease
MVCRVLLGEQLGLQGYLGGAAILTGVVITAFDSYRSQAKAVVPEVIQL